MTASVPVLGTGVSTAFGTFGELLQGVLPDGRDFLVTLPIARWSMATFLAGAAWHDVQVRPAHKVKARRLARMITAAGPGPVGGLLTLESGIAEGKGLASSSADLVATARAVGNALGVDLPPERIEEYLRRIEPTDGVLYDGIVAYHHREVRLLGRFGSLPSMTVVGVDEGGVVDTVEFNRIRKPFTAADRREYSRLLTRLRSAVRVGDLDEVGAVATRSAVMNQALRPRWTLDPLLDVCAKVGGLGVVAAHSGTTLGILLDPRAPGHRERTARAAAACSSLAGNATLHRTLSFGRTNLPKVGSDR
ncbi:kinase [Saccharothrix longispora]|uniref:GHMP family kinase ATP-binding protein n=1 Tax=Saccharothrix longispora TaxID=33920 RepID=UPI0028FD8D7F|nr:kinase [Saccharothrix longispora]MDU0288722.1 kinase [Saccharothrix longispora]